MKKSLVYVALFVLSSSMIYEMLAHPAIARAAGEYKTASIVDPTAVINIDHLNSDPKVTTSYRAALYADSAYRMALAKQSASTDLHNSQLSFMIKANVPSTVQASTASIVMASASAASDPSSPVNSNEGGTEAANNEASSEVKVTDRVALGDIASYHFPGKHNMSFVGPEATQELLNKEETGDLITGQILGSLLDRHDHAWVILMYTEDGHIFDYDHQQIDAKRILATYQNEFQQQNDHRSDAPKLQVLGWGKEPVYDTARHTLTWYMKLKNSTEDDVVNYNARILTRTGYLSAIMITDDQDFKQDSATFERDVLPNIDINPGSAYSAYDGDTDKDSKLTLEGLILTGAGTHSAKKYGTFSIVNKLWFVVVPIIGLFYWNHRNRSRREREHAKELEAILYADHQSNELPVRRRPAPPADQTDSDQK